MLYTVDIAVDLPPGADRASELVLLAAGLREVGPGRWRGGLVEEAAEELAAVLHPAGVEVRL